MRPSSATDSQLRILFVNHLGLGSASSYRQAGLAKYLSRLGHSCDFIGRSRLASNGGGRSDEAEWAPFLKKTFWSEPLVRGFRSNVRAYRREAAGASAVYVNRAYPYTSAVIAAGAARRKLVVDMEDWDGFGGYSSFAHLYGARGLLLTLPELTVPRRADLVVAVSRMIYGYMRRVGVDDSRLVLVPNGVDLELFDRRIGGEDVRQRLGLGGRPVVMYSSTFWRFEREIHEVAMDSFRRIVEEDPEVAVLMTGPGDLEVRTELRRAGLERNVFFTGYVRREEMPKLMAAADVAMHVISGHSFHRASSPMVVPEYMAMGRPVVAPGVGELAAMLEGGAGLPVARPDARLLADGVLGLLRDGRRRREMGELAFARAMSDYSYSVLSLRLAGALRRVLR
jgi:glycosyltransferase involved in cell wall biosynthesis